ncbi:MAG TPA: hypothetical protein VIC04_01185, partial [Terriglobia bacterium]
VLPDEFYPEIGVYSYGRGIFHKTPRTGLEVGDKDLFVIRDGDFIMQITCICLPRWDPARAGLS